MIALNPLSSSRSHIHPINRRVCVMSTSVLGVPASNLSAPTVLQLLGPCFHFDGNLIVLAGSSWVQPESGRVKKKSVCETEEQA